MKLKVKKLHPDAKLPTYATDGSACFDIYALSVSAVTAVPANKGMIFHTGLSFEIPRGWVMMIYSRSGHGFNKGVRLSNCVGVIDSDYRDEVKVKLFNDSQSNFLVERYDRIAQAMLVPVEKVEFEEVEELSTTARLGGFGSTGK